MTKVNSALARARAAAAKAYADGNMTRYRAAIKEANEIRANQPDLDEAVDQRGKYAIELFKFADGAEPQ